MEIAGYIIEEKATVRQTAGKFGVSKSTVHKDVTDRLVHIDSALKLVPPVIMSLEQALDFIDTDELLEVTPEHLRLRKKILDSRMRKRASINK